MDGFLEQSYWLSHNQGCAQYRIEELARFQFISVKLNWTGHTSQEVELEFALEWQNEEFTALNFKEIHPR